VVSKQGENGQSLKYSSVMCQTWSKSVIHCEVP